MVTQPNHFCPCSSNKDYGLCCQPLHEGEAARTPEQLMRSRYTAYVLQLSDYLLATWHPDTRPEQLDLSSSPDWQGLDIVSYSQQGTQGRVHFKAWYQGGKGPECIEEESRFIKQKGRWYYLNGLIR
ncbi:SEC-C motif-containing protein [Marinospirillum celere]|uniref:UPF0225 protein SAMN05660443_0584 n=1 Tax=Marinospirillum celere TaxID=1122252 RepID=A0A1I1EH67_9GAMM|nr:YchJ family metal-binding protein [Marinospirillum celere]SFB86016.1 SEC-C motif-containing protein [Marinospirillum celere]